MPRPIPFSISIPKPCSQPWHEMTPAGGDRFCTHCSSTVKDFTGLSDLEILKAIANASQPVCGRFRASQLNRDLEVLPAARPAAWPRLLIGALLLMATTGPGYLLAQSPALPISERLLQGSSKSGSNAPIENGNAMPATPAIDEMPASVRERSCDDLTLRIRVIDDRSLNRIPFARIEIPSIGLSAKADAEGKFHIELNRAVLDSVFEVMVHARKYLSASFHARADGAALVVEQEMGLTLERIEMGGPMYPSITHKTWRLLTKADRKYLESRGIQRPKKYHVNPEDRQYERAMIKKFKEVYSSEQGK